MNKFELFCLIFFALDNEWDKTQNEELGNYLSDANPFLFADIGNMSVLNLHNCLNQYRRQKRRDADAVFFRLSMNHFHGK